MRELKTGNRHEESRLLTKKGLLGMSLDVAPLVVYVGFIGRRRMPIEIEYGSKSGQVSRESSEQTSGMGADGDND